MTRVYLDWNATTPPHPDAVAAMAEALATGWGNPASVHGSGRRARQTVEDLRDLLASSIGCHVRDVIFTSGGTEANNLALHGARSLALSRIEHPSVIRAAERAEASGAAVEWVRVEPSGRVDTESLASALKHLPAPACVALQAANHETGVIQPLAEAIELARALGGWVHVDAVQTFGKVAQPALLEADSVAISAHKIRGPKGIGALIWKRPPGELRPLLVGGTQERGLRAGTGDAVAAAGFLAALQHAVRDPDRYAPLAELRDLLETTLAERAEINGGAAPRLPHVANLSFHGRRGDELVAALDLLGIEVSSGSACSAGSQEPSAVITAMKDQQHALGALRLSLGETTTRFEIERAIAALIQALARDPSSG